MSTRSRPAKTAAALPVLQPDAAGIDLGATAVYVAVPAERDPQPVRAFATFTADLLALAAWLQACHIRTVALEATGGYWIPLFQILETRGFAVCLVNGRHVKNVPGRKSDVCDCQWLQYLHAVSVDTKKKELGGKMLRIPPCAVRSIGNCPHKTRVFKHCGIPN